MYIYSVSKRPSCKGPPRPQFGNALGPSLELPRSALDPLDPRKIGPGPPKPCLGFLGIPRRPREDPKTAQEPQTIPNRSEETPENHRIP